MSIATSLAAVSVAIAALLAGQPPAAPAAPASPAPGAAAQTPVNSALQAADRPDAWWKDRNGRYAARAREGAQRGDIPVIFFGDSITEGWGGEGKGVWEKAFAPLGAVNFGIGGDRTQHLLWRLEHSGFAGLATPSAGAPPRLLVLMIGTNNSGENSAEEIAAGIKAVVEKARQKLPTTKVLVLGVFPRSAKPDEARSKLMQVNRLVPRMLEGMTSVEWFDFGNRFLELDGTISAETMPDALHLSPKGYQIWADAIEAKVRAAVGS